DFSEISVNDLIVTHTEAVGCYIALHISCIASITNSGGYVVPPGIMARTPYCFCNAYFVKLACENLAYDDNLNILADFSEISINDLIVTHTEAIV
ncbi:hypothetical protein CR513_40768, partial [Mucuna pruriens]